MPHPDLPQRARVVIVGGGIIGCSVAYHLAHAGWKDVVLLERDRLTSGTTWHAAGLIVTFGSTSETSTEMRKYTRDLYTRLEAETGQDTGFKPVGFIEVAGDADRLEEYRRVSAFNRLCGIDVHEISPREVKELFPLAETDDLLAGFYVKEDGRADPVGVTMALAKGARAQGARMIEGVAVTGVTSRRGVVTGVTTAAGDDRGRVRRQLRRHVGAPARRAVGRHDPAAGRGALLPDHRADPGAVDPTWPVLEDPGSYGYFREEVGGLMIGLFEPICAPWNVRGIPDDFSFGEIQPDWDRMGPYVEKAMARVPIALTAGVKKFFCGPESFTPDLQPVVGEAPELKNYFVAAGLNSIGIITGGGLGRVLAHWIMNGRPDVDVTGMNIDRLHPYQANPEYRAHAHRRVARHGLQVPLPDAHDADRARREAVAVLRPARAAGRVLPGRQRLGGRGLVPARRGDDRAALVGPAALVPGVGGRAPGGARGRDPDGHVVHVEVPRRGRDAGRLLDWISANNVDGPAGHDHVHAVARRGRQAAGGPDRDQARRRALLGRRVRHRAPPRPDLDEAPPPRGRARVRRRP